ADSRLRVGPTHLGRVLVVGSQRDRGALHLARLWRVSACAGTAGLAGGAQRLVFGDRLRRSGLHLFRQLLVRRPPCLQRHEVARAARRERTTRHEERVSMRHGQHAYLTTRRTAVRWLAGLGAGALAAASRPARLSGAPQTAAVVGTDALPLRADANP